MMQQIIFTMEEGLKSVRSQYMLSLSLLDPYLSSVLVAEMVEGGLVYHRSEETEGLLLGLPGPGPVENMEEGLIPI